MILTYCYRLLPRKAQHRALEAILEGQRQLYNAALEERMGAYRKAGATRTYVDQCKALTESRRGDPDAAGVPLCLQRWTLKQLDEAYRGFFRRVKAACAGTRLIEVDPYDTSQDCSGCGIKVPKRLDDRRHECPHCGLSIDRDLNAARNILHRAGVGPGLHNVADRGMRAGGNLVVDGGANCPRTCETLH